MVNSLQQARLAALLEPIHSKATRFCLRLCTTRQDAEDLYHDAVLAAWLGLPGLKDEVQFGPWFYRIIVNAFRNRERRRRWRRWVSLDSTDAAIGDRPDPSELPVVDPRGQLEARRWLRRGLAVLSADDRALITLFELEGHTVADVAQIFQLRKGTVKSRLSRARAKMRQAIAPHLDLPPTTEALLKKESGYALQPNHATSE